MATNRVIYQSEGLFITNGTTNPTGTQTSGVIKQLARVQSANYGGSLARQDVNQFGQLSRIDSLILESPNINFDFEYLVHDGTNEARMGMILDSSFGASALSGLLVADENSNSGTNGVLYGRNVFVLTTPQGTDANLQNITGTGAADKVNTVLGIGNAFMTEYSVNAAVGSLPTANVSFEGFNGRSTISTNNTGHVPSLSISGIESSASFTLPPTQTGTGISATALRPGDIVLTLGDSAILTDLDDAAPGTSAHVQSFSISVPMGRTTLQRLGSNFGYAKEIDFPVNIDVNVSALAADLKAGSFYQTLTGNSTVDLTMSLKDRTGSPKIVYRVKGAQIVSENFSSSIGSNKTVDINFTAQIGGPTDTSAGLFISGATTALPFA